MDHFNYQQNILHAEQVKISDIAEQIATPFYLYSSATFTRHFKVLSEALELENKLVCFAVKACSNIHILKLLGSLGSGADVVSQGEIYRALEAGIAANKIVFSGVGKSKEEINFALEHDILQFNAESKEELALINECAAVLGKKAQLALRINPDVAAKTHDKISTGKKGDKFGVDLDQAFAVIKYAQTLAHIDFSGVSVHIGSQITELDTFRQAFVKVCEFVKELEEQQIILKTIDFGGGLGVPYGAHDTIDPAHYGALISELVNKYAFQDKLIIFEPGRLIAANAGVLVTSIVLIKDVGHKKFAICDAAMNDLLRPALYGSAHEIVTVKEANSSTENYDIVGPVCETSDVFHKDLALPELKAGDLLVLRSAGAYGAVMSSEYNTRPLTPEILVSDTQFKIIRKRPSYQQMLALETSD